jgi:hypothetical protein
MINKMKQAQRGQSMTEFLICASFALVPLFLGISLLGKYIDIKQTTIQAARYEAWEYTVWFADNTETSSNFLAVPQPVKSTALTRNETKQRFFTDPGNGVTPSAIISTDSTTGWSAGTANPLWVDHAGQPLYAGVDGASESLNSSEDTPTIPIIGDVMNTLFNVIDAGFSAIRSLMSFANSAVGFTAINSKGNAEATVSMQVAVNPTFVANYNNLNGVPGTSNELTGGTLDFSTSASVLSDAWNAGGVAHTYNQAGGAVPTTLLNQLIGAIPGFTTIWNVVSILAPEMRFCNPGSPWPAGDKGSLWLGYVDIDAVHPDRLAADPTDPDTRNGVHVCDDAGICTFEPVIPRTEASKDCDP